MPSARYHPITSTSCQSVVDEELDRKALTGTITIQTDLTHPKLLPVIIGHVVNERILTHSVLYAEIAMTCADYFWRTLMPDAGPVGLNVCDFDVHKPLMVDVPPRPEGQHIQVECSAKLNEGSMSVLIRNVSANGETLQELGNGVIRFEDRSEWEDEWTRQKFLVQGQIEYLKQRLESGKTHKMLSGLAYKLFENLVLYSPTYQGMQSVVLDAEDTVAFAKVKLQYRPGRDGDFFLSPFAIDNLCHLSGFITNASDVDSAEPLVFISHGWESLKFLEPENISPEKEYTTFVKMVLGEKNISKGDVYIFEDEDGAIGDIVGVLYGLKFQGIPRRLIDVLLPPKSKKVAFVKTKGR